MPTQRLASGRYTTTDRRLKAKPDVLPDESVAVTLTSLPFHARVSVKVPLATVIRASKKRPCPLLSEKISTTVPGTVVTVIVRPACTIEGAGTPLLAPLVIVMPPAQLSKTI